MVWTDPQGFNYINRLAMSSFVLGLASSLIWAVTIVLEIKDRISQR